VAMAGFNLDFLGIHPFPEVYYVLRQDCRNFFLWLML
jgi:hypothetical protein